MTISTVIFRYLTSPKQNVLGVVDANHINNIKLSRQTVHQDAHAAPHWPGTDKLCTEWSSGWQSVINAKLMLNQHGRKEQMLFWIGMCGMTKYHGGSWTFIVCHVTNERKTFLKDVSHHPWLHYNEFPAYRKNKHSTGNVKRMFVQCYLGPVA